MQIEKTKKFKLPWRGALAVAGVIAASTFVAADTTSWGLGLTIGTPHTGFDGSTNSRISYNGIGGLAIDAGSTIVTAPSGETMVIADITGGPFPLNASGGCDTGFYALDVNGQNPACWTDDGFGKFKVRATVDGNGNVIGGTAAGQPDACGIVGGGNDLCVAGALLSCPSSTSSPHQVGDCFNQGASGHYQFVYQGNLLTAQVNTNLGTGIFAAIDHLAMGAPTAGTPFGVGDSFEFLLQITGGPMAAWYAQVSASDPRKFVDVQAQGCPVGSSCDASNGSTVAPTTSTDGFNTILWSTPNGSTQSTAFSEVVEGGTDSVHMFPFFLPPPDLCNGQITGSVTNYVNGGGVPGAGVQNGTGPIIPTATNGAYTIGGLCAGTYTINLVTPAGYNVNGVDTASVTITNTNGNDNVVTGVNFQIYASAVSTANFTTFTQAVWGTPAKGQNASALLGTYFSLLYPTGLVVGDPAKFTVTENSAAFVVDFLPQNFLPLPLTASYVDPPSKPLPINRFKFPHNKMLGSLAGETMALQLNVDFSNAGLTKPGLSALKVQSGPFVGQSVGQVLALANCILGGDSVTSCGGVPVPAPITKLITFLGPKNALLFKYDIVEDTVEAINKNFLNGSVNRGFVK